MRPVRRRLMVPDIDRIETCLLRSDSASAGGRAGGRSEVRIDPMDAIIVSLCGQCGRGGTHRSYTQREEDAK